MLMMVKTTAQGMFDKNKIKRADNFLKGRGGTVNAQAARPKLSEYSLCRQRRRPWYGSVMSPKRAKLMRVGSCNQRFAKFFRDLHRSPVGIEKAFVKMTKLNRVEAIDLIQ